jgi:hypothetical protein
VLLKKKGVCKNAGALISGQVGSIARSTLSCISKTPMGTKRRECEDLFIPLPDEDLQKIRGKICKIYKCVLGCTVKFGHFFIHLAFKMWVNNGKINNYLKS